MPSDNTSDAAAGAVDPETLYTKQQCIGGGSFGKVYKGLDKRTGRTVAIKIVEIEAANDDVKDIIEEISILAGLNSPYVTKYYGSFLKGSDLWIIMEFCSGGSCSDLMRPGIVSEEYVCIILHELLLGLEYLHGDKKLHRDIKAANILLGANGQVKLADFGVSGQLSATMTKKNTFVGTPFWMAPEVIKQAGYDHKADIWSLGITAIELAVGEPPMADIHPMKVLFLIPKHPPPKLEGNFSPVFKDFVGCCLRRDARDRPTAKELLKHPFVKKAKKPTYLTELIERHERWQIQHRKNSDYDDSDEGEDPRPANAIDDDLWDFGTIKPANGRMPGLKPMNDAEANARNLNKLPIPTKGQIRTDGDENSQEGPRETIRPPPPAINSLQSNLPPPLPVLRSQPVPPLTTNSPSKVPLPPSPIKPQPNSPVKSEKIANLSRKPLPNTSFEVPIRLDTHDYLNQAISRDLSSLSLMDGAKSTRSSDVVSNPQIASRPTQAEGPPAHIKIAADEDTTVKTTQLNSDLKVSNKAPGQPSDKASEPPSIMKQTSPSKPSSASDLGSQAQQKPPTQQMSEAANPMTALHGVVLPALQASLNRRSYNVNQLLQNKTSNSNVSSGDTKPSTLTNDQRTKQLEAQEAIQKLVHKTARLFKEMENWDEWAPVGMGDEVSSFMEGFLEEVLVRIEPQDE